MMQASIMEKDDLNKTIENQQFNISKLQQKILDQSSIDEERHQQKVI